MAGIFVDSQTFAEARVKYLKSAFEERRGELQLLFRFRFRFGFRFRILYLRGEIILLQLLLVSKEVNR